jgi:hypothetical protein
MRVGILELLLDTVTTSYTSAVFGRLLRRQFYSIMPQVVAVWARGLGHEVHYATYYGQSDPANLLPADLDIVFISTYTQASALANAMSVFYRMGGALTVAGGPHAKAFPEECQRFFDIVVGNCDKALIGDILNGRIASPAIVSSARAPTEFPSVEERLPEIAIAAFHGGRATKLSIVSLLASTGCPYTCDFCSDWNNNYHAVSTEGLSADIHFVSKTFPAALLAFHDPNFAVRFDETMDVLETVPEERRNCYVMESSLSILKESRIQRLRRTRCVFAAPGVESWGDYGNKAGTKSLQGRAKLDSVVAQFENLHKYIPGLQANLLFGTDLDRGSEPVELTKEFMLRLPYVWPGINIPTPYGGTPLYDRYLEEGRILREMPISLYFAPYLVTTLKHYGPLEYYDHLIDIYELMTSKRMLVERIRARGPNSIRLAHVLRTLAMRQELAEQRRVRAMLATDPGFRNFHEGRAVALPEYYHHVFERQLGRYAKLILPRDRIPLPRRSSRRAVAVAGGSA